MHTQHRIKANVAAALAALVATATPAHVVIDPPTAPAGSSVRAVLRVGHGCDGLPTTQLRVRLPAGLAGAKPMPKAGWDLQLRRAPLAEPRSSHGKNITEDVVEITFIARTPQDALPDAYYDEFVFRAGLPAEAGPLWVAVEQRCKEGAREGVLDWAQVPASGTSTAGLKAPATLLMVTPVAPVTPMTPVVAPVAAPSAPAAHQH